MAMRIIFAALMTAAMAAASNPADILETLHGQDVAVEAVGYRLATANAELCHPGGWDPGFSVHTLEQYGVPYRPTASRLFNLRGRPGVLSVAAGSASAAAGLRAGDELVAVGPTPLPDHGSSAATPDFQRTAVVQQAIRGAFSTGRAELLILRAGLPMVLTVKAAPACFSLFQVAPDAAMNGAADGDYVQVSSEMAALAQSEDELAAALAHELAHNILGHKMRLDALHVDRGPLSAFGRNAHLIRETEAEADRLSIYLLARAGYETRTAIVFWGRYQHKVQGFDPTHPAWDDRLRSMRREIDRIAASGVPPAETPLPPDLANAIPGH